MIAAIVLAGGQSKRMGQPKMLLRWGNLTVIEQVISTFLGAGIEEILVITGSAREQVERVLDRYPVRKVHNEAYAAGEMLSSLQCGIRNLPEDAQGTLIGLGDQPQVEQETIRILCDRFGESKAGLVVPSFRSKRGHPWLVAQPLWHGILALKPPQTPRDFLNSHASEILYVSLDTPTVLADLDTPEDYLKSRPRSQNPSQLAER